VLDCYDSQVHDQACKIEGATNTDTTHYRCIRSSPSCATPFAGTKDTGARFHFTGAWISIMLALQETFSRVEQLSLKYTLSTDGATYVVSLRSNTKVIDCVIHDSVNNFVGRDMQAIRKDWSGFVNILIFQNIVYGCDGIGYWVYGEDGIICNTAVNNGGVGFYSDSNLANFLSNYASDNSADFRDISGKWSADSGWNSSKDTTSDLGGDTTDCKNSNDLVTGGELDADYLATEAISWAGGAGDNAGKSPFGAFITAVGHDFDGFFSAVSPDPLALKDIAGNNRPAGDDVAWDVGASQYVADTGVDPGPFAQPFGFDGPFSKPWR